MSTVVFWGIFSVGFVFGYLLYYAVRHTQNFNIDMLGVAIGAVGSATVIGFLGNNPDWIGPYGLGLAAGFLVYFFLSVIFVGLGVFDKFANIGILTKILLGSSTVKDD